MNFLHYDKKDLHFTVNYRPLFHTRPKKFWMKLNFLFFSCVLWQHIQKNVKHNPHEKACNLDQGRGCLKFKSDFFSLCM